MWQNVEFGMSEKQVLAAQPNAKQNARPSTLSDGSACSLHIQLFLLLNEPYEVCFYFKDNKFNQVTLGHRGKPSKGHFDDVLLLFREKYEVSAISQRTVLGYESEFMISSDVNVSIVYLEDIGVMNINYQIRIKDEMNKI